MGPSDSIKRGRFYQESVTFQVEDTLHRVPRFGFEKWSNSVFVDLFRLPQGEVTEGQSDENPIKLPCSNFEFESLLEVMYPLELGELNLSKLQWTGALKLAKCWDMPKIAAMAVKALDGLKLNSIEKVKIGRECNIARWLRDGYSELAQDPYKVSLEEMSAVGWETMAKILWISGNKSPKVGRGKATIHAEDVSCVNCDQKTIDCFSRKHVGTPFWCTACLENWDSINVDLWSVDAILNLQRKLDATDNVLLYFKAEIDEVESHDL